MCLEHVFKVRKALYKKNVARCLPISTADLLRSTAVAVVRVSGVNDEERAACGRLKNRRIKEELMGGRETGGEDARVVTAMNSVHSTIVTADSEGGVGPPTSQQAMDVLLYIHATSRPDMAQQTPLKTQGKRTRMGIFEKGGNSVQG